MRPSAARRTLSLAAAAAVAGAGVAAAANPTALPGVSSYLQTHQSVAAAESTIQVPPATPKADCGPGSLPETGRQGRVPLADYDNGRAAKGYTCNAEQVGHVGTTGGTA